MELGVSDPTLDHQEVGHVWRDLVAVVFDASLPGRSQEVEPQTVHLRAHDGQQS